MLQQRVLTAVVLVVAVLAALFLVPPPGWAVATLAAIAAAAFEWASLAGLARSARRLFVAVTLLLGAGLLFVPQAGFERGWPAPMVLVVCGAATLFWVLAAPPWLAGQWKPARAVVWMLAGWLVLVGAWMALVQLQARSPWLVLAAMALVWVADIAAYFAGRAFGRRKLAPDISPGKTWAGVHGALAAVAVYAIVLVSFAEPAGYHGERTTPAILAWVALALALAALSVVGDLFESLLKRQAGRKDSGTLLPGHGGILDRVDALLAAMPAAALLAQAFLG
jgi:phosphatidate cytidylyltransferase